MSIDARWVAGAGAPCRKCGTSCLPEFTPCAPCLQHYLDYDALKQSIKDCAEAQRAAAQQQGPPLSVRALLEDSQAKFQSQLDAEVLKVVRFYQQHSAQLLEVRCFLLCCRRCIPAALGLR